MSGSCEYASTIMPDYFCLSVQNVTNGSCTDCAVYNQSWLLTQQGSGSCSYASILYDICSGVAVGQIWLYFSAASIDLVFNKGPDLTIAFYSETIASPYDSTIPHTLPLFSNIFECDTWPATLIINPTNNWAACVGDPHFIGFENDKFDVHGIPGTTYNLISDYNVSVNALFGNYPSVPGTTYLEEIEILIGTKEVGFTTIKFSSKGGGVYVNGKLMKTKKQEFPTGLLVNPIGSVEVTMHSNWQNLLNGLPADGIFQNGIIVNTGNFKLKIPRFISSLSHLSIFAELIGTPMPILPHGIIGQTADFDDKPRIGTGPNGEGAIDGKPEDYEVKDLFSPDFPFSRFAETASLGKNNRDCLNAQMQDNVVMKNLEGVTCD